MPGAEEAYSRQFPYAVVALAIVAQRGSRGLTQARLASMVGTTQSVIARLESGRHPIRIDLLTRIAEALGTTWAPVFTDPTEAHLANVAGTGDILLDAFNAANTARDFDQARSVAVSMGAEPPTPRRSLAIAMDAFNHAEYERALEWADRALSSPAELPPTSLETAMLVRGRALLALGEADDAVKQLQAFESESLGWLVDAARAEALSEAGRNDEAVAAAYRALSAAPETPEMLYIAARVEWHANRPWDALGHVAAFRGHKPLDSQGAMLHGAILGFLGDQTGDSAAYEAALQCFAVALASDGCHARRLYARALSRLGRTREAIDQAREILASSSCDEHREMAELVLTDALAGFDGPGDELEKVVQEAEGLGVGDPTFFASQRCLARALQGDVTGAAAALGLEVEAMAEASLPDQIRFSAAHVMRGDLSAAFPFLLRCEKELACPDGLVMLAQCALTVGDTVAAKRALDAIREAGGPASETADVALRLVRVAEQEGAKRAVFAALASGDRSASRWIDRVESGWPAPETGWEGAHSLGTAMLMPPGKVFVH
jgi:transcriptional regulator with XRE-family HTH domain